MGRFERSQELARLRDDCKALEDKAGLSKLIERAREGRFIPLGAFGEETSPQEYFADEHDHLRGKTRDAYFSVTNMGLRKQLIATQRLVESRLRQLLQQDIIAANREVLMATANVQHQPWGKAALFSIGAVAIGYWVFGIVGAISGAVGGFFLGQVVISKARNEVNMELAWALNGLELVEEEESENSLMPKFFSHSEEISGERDTALDSQSAYANVLCDH
jgi:hypothetical protein